MVLYHRLKKALESRSFSSLVFSGFDSIANIKSLFVNSGSCISPGTGSAEVILSSKGEPIAPIGSGITFAQFQNSIECLGSPTISGVLDPGL